MIGKTTHKISKPDRQWALKDTIVEMITLDLVGRPQVAPSYTIPHLPQ
jgi:hypothetical protein